MGEMGEERRQLRDPSFSVAIPSRILRRRESDGSARRRTGRTREIFILGSLLKGSELTITAWYSLRVR